MHLSQRLTVPLIPGGTDRTNLDTGSFERSAIPACDAPRGNIAMNQQSLSEPVSASRSFILDFWGVRYQVEDIGRSVDFYTNRLGFKLDFQHPPAFAQVSIGNLKLILSGPGASGSRAMPDGLPQESGGWNRIILKVADLPDRIEALQKTGLHFRNRMETGPGGKQIQLEDPDGNPIELFEPAE